MNISQAVSFARKTSLALVCLALLQTTARADYTSWGPTGPAHIFGTNWTWPSGIYSLEGQVQYSTVAYWDADPEFSEFMKDYSYCTWEYQFDADTNFVSSTGYTFIDNLHVDNYWCPGGAGIINPSGYPYHDQGE